MRRSMGRAINRSHRRTVRRSMWRTMRRPMRRTWMRHRPRHRMLHWLLMRWTTLLKERRVDMRGRRPMRSLRWALWRSGRHAHLGRPARSWRALHVRGTLRRKTLMHRRPPIWTRPRSAHILGRKTRIRTAWRALTLWRPLKLLHIGRSMLRSGRRSLWRPRTLRTVGTWRTIPLGLMEPGRRSLVGRWATVHWRRALHARRSHPWGRHRSTHTLRRGHDHPRWAVLVVTWGTRWVLMRMMALATASV